MPCGVTSHETNPATDSFRKLRNDIDGNNGNEARNSSLCETDQNEARIATKTVECDLSLTDILTQSNPGRFEDIICDRDFICRFLNQLSPREERVIRLRFGLSGIGEHTLREIAGAFGCAPSRIRQIEQRALRKLRYWAAQTFPSRKMIRKDISSDCHWHVQTRTRRQQTGPERRWSSSEPSSRRGLRSTIEPKRHVSDEYHAAHARRGAAIQVTNICQPKGSNDLSRSKARFPASIWIGFVSSLTFAILCAIMWWNTLGVKGAASFGRMFGTAHAPIIRLFAWFVSFCVGSVAAMISYFYVESWMMVRRCSREVKFPTG